MCASWIASGSHSALRAIREKRPRPTSTERRQPDADDVPQIMDVLRDIDIDCQIQVSTDGVEAVVALRSEDQVGG